MKFSKEQIMEVKNLKSPEEIVSYAKSNATDMSIEEAGALFSKLHTEGEIADDELDNVAGGCDEEENCKTLMGCAYCGYRVEWHGNYVGKVCECSKCGKTAFLGIEIVG